MIETQVWMDTPVTIEVAAASSPGVDAAVAAAFRWFAEVEAACSRFQPQSELRRLLASPGTPVTVSPLLWEALRFALAVAEASDGVFDPTVGATLERRGYDREFRTGQRLQTAAASTAATWRDVRLDSQHRTLTLLRPLVLDLGAVAKGMAVDLAARALRSHANPAIGDFAIDAGGDLYLAGRNREHRRWRIALRPPREGASPATLELGDAAVCSSGDYERGPGQFVARGGLAAIAATVIAPTAMAADAFSTTALLLGPEAGIAWLEAQGECEGLIMDSGMRLHTTPGWSRYQISD